MRSAFSSCRLYSWMRLTWLSKIESGSTVTPDVGLEPSAKLRLRLALGLADGIAEAAVIRPAAAACASSVRSVIQPSPIASVILQARAGFASSSQRRGVTPLVLLLNRSGYNSARSLTVTVRSRSEWMRGNAVRAVRADDGEVRHPDLALAALLDEADAPDAALVAREAGPHLIEQPAVDLEDDLEVPRQQQLEPGERPLLQRLGQQRVVRVGERPTGEIPGVVPAETAPRRAGSASAREPRGWGACR